MMYILFTVGGICIGLTVGVLLSRRIAKKSAEKENLFVMKTVFHALEVDREHTYQIIHDKIIQSLSAQQFDLEILKGSVVNSEDGALVLRALTKVSYALRYAHAIGFGLHPEDLSELPLPRVVGNYIDLLTYVSGGINYKPSNFLAELTYYEKVFIFRIAQALLLFIKDSNHTPINFFWLNSSQVNIIDIGCRIPEGQYSKDVFFNKFYGKEILSIKQTIRDVFSLDVEFTEKQILIHLKRV